MKRMDCFVARAPRNDGGPSRYGFAISRLALPEVCSKSFALSKQRAQGMPDARCTRDLVCNSAREYAHEHTGQRRTSDIPCAMALRLITSSPRRTALLPPSLAGLTANLTPAPRRQDHTSSPYALAPFAIGTTSVHRDPSHDRGDHDTPLLPGRDGDRCAPDLAFGKSEIFFILGLDTISANQK